MPRTFLPYAVDDISALARSLRDQLSARAEPPSHVEMLNMLARAAGERNFQSFRARRTAVPIPPAEPKPEPEVDLSLLDRTARHFDAEGRLASWPAKTRLQSLALWGLWSQIEPGQSASEVEFNRRLNTISLIGDPALLRRSLFSAGLIARTDDCRDYRRIEATPPPEAAALIRRLQAGRLADAQAVRSG